MPVKPNASEEHSTSTPTPVASGDAPLTVNAVIKWMSIVFTVVSALVSFVWFAAIMKGDIISSQQELSAVKHEDELRFQQEEKDIDKLNDRADLTDRSLSDMGSKLDVAVAILERIEKNIDERGGGVK
jgi:hypothetical protein